MKWYTKIFLIGVMLFFVLPLLIVLICSFTSAPRVSFPPEGFSIQWYFTALSSAWFQTGLKNSLIAASFCTVLAVPVGMLASYGLLRYKIRARNAVQVYLLLPFTVPLVVQGISLLFIYARAGMVGNILGIGFALMEINLPFMIWSVSSAVNRMDPNLENASMSLGANEIYTFLHITIPALLPGIMSGGLLMFVLGLNEFVTSLMLTTIWSSTLPISMYTRIKTAITPDVAAAAAIYIVIAIIAIIILDRTVGIESYLK
ncbi:MAG: ABC transporter permease [Hadesarchaea archaeon]|nr:ABC transporter permease [Hadesarchaea archaeon]